MRSSVRGIAGIVGSVAVITLMTVSATWALSGFINYEVEDGSVSERAEVVTDSLASGNQAVRFGADVAVACSGIASFGPDSPDPWGGCWPGDTNTGVPDGQTLTVVDGDQIFGSSYNGQTISNREFRGFVRVTGSNITFVNCWFRGATATGTTRLLNTHDSGGNITVIDSDFAPMNPSVEIDGVRAANTTLIRVNIANVVDGIKAGNGVIVRDSYIHDMAWYANDPKQGGGQTHNDGIQILSGSNIQLIHNMIFPAGENGSNAAIQITQDQGIVDDVLIDRNGMDYGGCTLNIAHNPLGSLTGVTVRDNLFGRNQRYNNCAILLSSGVTLAGYSGNVWGDTGLPIPSP